VISEHRFEAKIALMLGHGAVHMVDEDDIGLAGGQPGFDDFGEQPARIDGLPLFARFRADQIPAGAVAHRFHERISDQHAMVQVQGFSVEIA
jgi:hypothetical protein